MTPMYYQMGYPYALQPQQQRLMEMEQQYQMGQPMQPQPMQAQPMQLQNRQQYMKCRAVTSIDEAKASMIDLDGSVHVFTDIGNKKIYTKQINLDGTATLNTYELVEKPVETQAPKAEPQENVVYVKQSELEAVCRGFSQQIADLTARIADYEDILFGEEEPEPKPKPAPKPATKGGTKK